MDEKKYLTVKEMNEFKKNFNDEKMEGKIPMEYDLLQYASKTNEYIIGQHLLDNFLFNKGKKVNVKDNIGSNKKIIENR